jgi:hypothetical protein
MVNALFSGEFVTVSYKLSDGKRIATFEATTHDYPYAF